MSLRIFFSPLPPHLLCRVVGRRCPACVVLLFLFHTCLPGLSLRMFTPCILFSPGTRLWTHSGHAPILHLFFTATHYTPTPHTHTHTHTCHTSPTNCTLTCTSTCLLRTPRFPLHFTLLSHTTSLSHLLACSHTHTLSISLSHAFSPPHIHIHTSTPPQFHMRTPVHTHTYTASQQRARSRSCGFNRGWAATCQRGWACTPIR
jgi:hypothetical protein